MASKIKAAIRVRPFLPSEVKNGYRNNTIAIDQNKKEIYIKEDANKRCFHFDYLFSEDSTQEEIYKNCKVDSMIDRAIEGYHSTIFAYGQTGSGKTYTMQGAETIEDGSRTQLNGLIPKAIHNLYKKIQNHPDRTFSISVSFLQIYNQKIFDLLNPSSLNPKTVGTPLNGLRMRWNKDEQFSVENLFVFECKNSDQLIKYFLYGLKNRISSSHKLNMSSSRSHSILTIRLESFHHKNPTHILCSKMELVDLAGSERIGMTGTEGKLAKESIDINKSLFTLRQVISILAEAGKGRGKEKGYVPYRDSKLTSILKQSIGGNSYSLMIACINPNDTFLEENLSTLTYATKATYITNQPTINDDPRSKAITDLKKQVRQLNEELSKANKHIQIISNMNETNKSEIPKNPWTENSQRLEDEIEGGIPNPRFSKKMSDRTGSYDQFSERLVESINMVRELLKSNKELREQLELSNQRNEEKDIEIFELNRQNEYLKEKYGADPQVLNSSGMKTEERKKDENMSQGKKTEGFKTQNNQNIRVNPRMNKTSMIANGNIYGFKGNNANNNFNYWNSVEINQYYMNEKGIDSKPTNFNSRREVNSAQNARMLQTRGSSAEKSDRQAITANMTKRSWMSKNSQAKKFLSFYNDPSKEEPGIY